MSHYQTLGIDKNATPEDIKKAYRKLASIHHPDKGGDTSTFQKIQAAYEVLSDPVKRQQYDNPQPQFTQGFPGGFQFNQGGFEDFFSTFFKQTHNNDFNQKRQQVFRTTLGITLEQVYFGGGQTIQLQTIAGIKIINVEIPKGVPDGGQVRLDSVIEQGTLVVEFRTIKHLQYDRNGNDLLSNFPVSVLDLITGTTKEFKTISGSTIEVVIPPKTQPNIHFRLAGKGLPIFNTGSFGDQILLIKPFIPDIISEEILNAIISSKLNKE
jgi:DnaJ-class molecular chaperone